MYSINCLAVQSRSNFHVRWSLNSWLDRSKVQTVSFRLIWQGKSEIQLYELWTFPKYKLLDGSNLLNHFPQIYSTILLICFPTAPAPTPSTSGGRKPVSTKGFASMAWALRLVGVKTGLPKTGAPYARFRVWGGMRDGHRHPAKGETAHGQRGATSAELQSFNGGMEM